MNKGDSLTITIYPETFNEERLTAAFVGYYYDDEPYDPSGIIVNTYMGELYLDHTEYRLEEEMNIEEKPVACQMPSTRSNNEIAYLEAMLAQGKIMDQHQLLKVLEDNQEKNLQFELDGEKIPVHYHITQVSLQHNKIIDCGGDFSVTDNLTMQLWVANDEDHRMTSGKALKIFQGLGYLLNTLNPKNVLVEYGSPISLYVLTSFYIEENNLILAAEKTATDCPAKDKCVIEGCC